MATLASACAINIRPLVVFLKLVPTCGCAIQVLLCLGPLTKGPLESTDRSIEATVNSSYFWPTTSSEPWAPLVGVL